jgi:hypothetical protein
VHVDATREKPYYGRGDPFDLRWVGGCSEPNPFGRLLGFIETGGDWEAPDPSTDSFLSCIPGMTEMVRQFIAQDNLPFSGAPFFKYTWQKLWLDG